MRLALACLLARGHLLLEDLPGVGKTTLALALARVLGLDFGRIQFTSDLLPTDIVGVSVIDVAAGSLTFRPGPVFHQVVLADEINRATPRTQSALLEAMAEGQVSVEGRTHPLPAPFFVIATQNPIEHYGTFPLPESQMDRFMMTLKMGYPGRDAERSLLADLDTRARLDRAGAVIDLRELTGLQDQAAGRAGRAGDHRVRAGPDRRLPPVGAPPRRDLAARGRALGLRRQGPRAAGRPRLLPARGRAGRGRRGRRAPHPAARRFRESRPCLARQGSHPRHPRPLKPSPDGPLPPRTPRSRRAAVHIRLTTTGAIAIALLLAAGIVAVNSGNNLLYLVVASLLAALALSGLLGHHNLRRVVVRLIAPDEAWAGRPVSVRAETLQPPAPPAGVPAGPRR